VVKKLDCERGVPGSNPTKSIATAFTNVWTRTKCSDYTYTRQRSNICVSERMFAPGKHVCPECSHTHTFLPWNDPLGKHAGPEWSHRHIRAWNDSLRQMSCSNKRAEVVVGFHMSAVGECCHGTCAPGLQSVRISGDQGQRFAT